MLSLARTAPFKTSKIGAVTVRLAISCSVPMGIFAKPAYRENRTIHRQRRNDDVDARSVGQARIAHGRRFVHPPPHLGDDLVDDVAQMRLVLEHDIGLLQHAGPLHVNPAYEC